MLCDGCNEHFRLRRELADYQDGRLPLLARRNAAVILVTLARGRKRNSTNDQLRHSRRKRAWPATMISEFS